MTQGSDDTLTLTHLIERAREHARWLYDGVETPHRSCGISIAETFGLPTAPYQSLRKGGITGCGECGAIKGGELVLGQLLGDPDPRGAVTPQLRQAAFLYRDLWREALDLGDGPAGSIVCNDLTSQFEHFKGPERHAFCTALAAGVADAVARTLAQVAPDVLEARVDKEDE